MRILRNPRIQGIVFMMHLMIFIEETVMDEPVEEVKDHILEVIDEQYLKTKFRESWKVLKTQLDSI